MIADPRVHIVPVLSDNYCYVVEGDNNACVIVDPGEAAPVAAYVDATGLLPELILNTHHHSDHVGGNAELKSRFNIPVTGPEAERARIPAIDSGVRGGDRVDAAGFSFQTIDTPGHTKGHVVFFESSAQLLFSGDTLFSLGCGRLFEDSAEAMFQSLAKIRSLPPETKVYCGHEYTEQNAAFALSLNHTDAALLSRVEEIRGLRRKNRPSVPFLLREDIAANPFLKAATVEEFTRIRHLKDVF